MQLFQNIDSNTFTFNGVMYVKNFMIIKQGSTNISVHNAYDTSFQLMGSTHYSQVKVNGLSYSNQANLMNALATLIFAKQVIDTAGVILSLTGITDTYTTGATMSGSSVIFTNNYDGVFTLSGLSDTLQNATDKGNSTTNSIRIIDETDDNTFGELKKNQLIFHKADGSGVGFNADNTTEYYRLQAPDKTGGGDFTIATTDDIDSSISGINLQQVSDQGNTTSNDLFVNTIKLYNPAWEAYHTLSANDTAFIVSNPTGASVLIQDNNSLSFSSDGIAFANFVSQITESRNYNLPDKNGTVALLDDITTPTLNSILLAGNSSLLGINLTDGTNQDTQIDSAGILIQDTLSNYSSHFYAGELSVNNGSDRYSVFSNNGILFNIAGSVQQIKGNPAQDVTHQPIFQPPVKNTNGTFTLVTTEDLGFVPTLDAVISSGNTIYNKAIRFNSPSGVVSLSGQAVTSSNAFVFPSKNPQSTPIILGTNLDDITNGSVSGGLLSLKNLSGTTLATISLPDTYVTGGTYSNGVTVFSKNNGITFSVTGFSTGFTLTSSAITSTLGYTPLSSATDTYTIGGAYSSGTTVFTNNTGGTFSVTGYPTTITTSGITDIKNYTEVMNTRWIWSDMLYTSSIQPFVGGALSSGSILGGSDVSDTVCGVNLLRSSSTANSGYNIYLNQAILGNLKGSEVFETQLIHYNLSGTTTRFGFTANINATTDFTYGCYFEIINDQLYAKTANNSTRTSVLLGTVPSASNYYVYRITISSPSSINYSVYNSSGGTVIFSTNITTNIPSTFTTYNNSMKVNIVSFNSGTTLSNLCGLDYLKIYLGDNYNRGPIRI